MRQSVDVIKRCEQFDKSPCHNGFMVSQQLGYTSHSEPSDFGVTRILLFGSLAKGKFNAGSDIDLAVADLPPDLLFLAIARAGKLSEFPIDLKPLDALSEHFLRWIMESGEEI
ncbi:MAG: nucleotidyltransferase family protein [Caldilinea sp.]